MTATRPATAPDAMPSMVGFLRSIHSTTIQAIAAAAVATWVLVMAAPARALEAVAEATGAPTAALQLDAEPLPVRPDRFLAGGDVIVIGKLTFDVIHLRGHTPGSVALALRPDGDRKAVQLFTGDCLFPGGVGKTWEPGGFEELLGDVNSQLFGVYGDDTVVYPGHGDDTTLGDERPHIEEWRERGW